jgi:hypothetical protein
MSNTNTAIDSFKVLPAPTSTSISNYTYRWYINHTSMGANIWEPIRKQGAFFSDVDKYKLTVRRQTSGVSDFCPANFSVRCGVSDGCTEVFSPVATYSSTNTCSNSSSLQITGTGYKACMGGDAINVTVQSSGLLNQGVQIVLLPKTNVLSKITAISIPNLIPTNNGSQIVQCSVPAKLIANTDTLQMAALNVYTMQISNSVPVRIEKGPCSSNTGGGVPPPQNRTVGQLNNSDVIIYPNPTNGNFYLQLPNAPTENNVIIDVLSIQGERIQSFMTNQQITELNMSDYAAGMYLLRVKNGLAYSTHKVVLIK